MCELYDEEVKEKDAAVKDALEMISDTKAAIAELNTEIDGLKVAAQNESAIPHHVSHLQQQTTSSQSNNGDTATTSPADENERQENGENGATQRTLLSVAGRSVRVHETYDENTLQQQFADNTQEA
jgi:TPP-dependent trihydroxycyclohexane-1,2-dione (THcHDO) dehydratase